MSLIDEGHGRQVRMAHLAVVASHTVNGVAKLHSELMKRTIFAMVNQMSYNAPLYGRFTAQLPVDPLPFGALRDFLPRFPAAERIAVYAVAGGIPAYLEQFSDGESVGANLKRLFIRRTGMFRSEPLLLVGDVIRRETQTYQSVLKAIAAGLRTPGEIGATLDLPASYLSPYLKQLEALRLVERRIPATVPPERRATSRNSRYHLADPYLRFYFRFIEPNPDGRILYTVVEGDNCSGVALNHGITVQQLRQYNTRLDDSCNLNIGQQLVVGLVAPITAPTIGIIPTPTLPSVTATPFNGTTEVCILLFHDLNGDALRQETEFGIDGGAVSLTNLNGSYSQTQNTTSAIDPDLGEPIRSCFEDVPAGKYNISMAIPDGYNPTMDPSYTFDV